MKSSTRNNNIKFNINNVNNININFNFDNNENTKISNTKKLFAEIKFINNNDIKIIEVINKFILNGEPINLNVKFLKLFNF